MLQRILTITLLMAGVVFSPPALSLDGEAQAPWASVCKDWDDWDKPGPAFRVHGNTYYVGTCGISSILITGREGHVLIDGGTEVGAHFIVENISSLGFDIKDVKILLHSHEHFDHVAGLASLQRDSGAVLYASKAAAPVLSSGNDSSLDPQYGMHEPFPPSRVDRIIEDGQVITLGDIALTVVATPGHTPGALSWRWESCEADACETIMYADSISPVSADGYRFSDFPDYVDAFRQGLATFSGLGCSLLLSTHPSASHMRARLKTGSLTQAGACAGHADRVASTWDKRLQKERTEN